MNHSLLYQTPTYIIVAVLFFLMIFVNWIGFRFHKRQNHRNPDATSDGLGPVEGSLLGLLALLLSFTFGMSASRYDTRRHVIVEEANDIGTAVLRSDLYPDSIRNSIRADFKEYVEARIEYYKGGIDEAKITAALEKANGFSKKIWKTIMIQAQNKDNLISSQQMIPAMNNVIDDVTTRENAQKATVPDSILWLLFILILTASTIVGYSANTKKINRIVVCGFALMTVMTVYLILDLDRPMRGIINTNATEKNIVELRKLFVD